MDNEFVKKQIDSLNKHLEEDNFNYPEDRYSFAAGFMQAILEGLIGMEIEINYKGYKEGENE